MRCSLTCRPAELHAASTSKQTCSSVCGASAVAIDNKIEQAMDLVKGHLMLAVREEVEVLKERIKELWERNSELRRENTLLKSLANLQQLQTLSAHLSTPQSAPQSPQLDQQAQLAEWARQVQRAQIAEWAWRVQWVQQVQMAEWTQLAVPTSPNGNSAALIHHSMTSV
ncbi:TSC22 domain family protein 3-like [Colossoma macropomum]|uniref:TSC22 domain family protein 3-like n=1 Tax=Colossoma macropomum TaxID=42526 RepID=UPI00186509C4|nr:TSC22 domain family protein 3-like [Colossoma macropomum]